MKPRGENIFEFGILARDESGAFAKLVQVFAIHKIDIRSATTSRVYDKKTKSECTVAGLFCDFTSSDCTVENLETELKALKFIIEVQYYDMKDRMWERFLFPTTLAGSRIIMLRADPLLRIERNLIDRMGTAGAAIMFHEGEVYAEQAFEEIKKMLPGAQSERLLQCVIDALRATGWGIVEFHKLPAGFEAIVKDPPILTDADYKENRFLYGAASRLLELIYGAKIFLSESSFDEKNSILILKYSLQTSKILIPAIQ